MAAPSVPDHEQERLPSDVRPWGRFYVLDEAPGFKVKRIEVEPGQRLSYQLHHHRSEHWIVVGGEACVTLDDLDTHLRAGDSVDIPIAARHRIRNSGSHLLVFVEVQRGEYVGEDDIVRIEDDFGRS